MSGEETRRIWDYCKVWLYASLQWLGKPKVTKSAKVDLAIEERVASAMERYEAKLDTIEKTLDAKCNKEQLQAIVNDSISSLPHSSPTKQNKKLTSDTVKEIADRQARENNIEIYNCQESKSQLKTVKQKHDLSIVTNLFTELDVTLGEEDNDSVKRLGRKQDEHDESQRPRERPLLVSFQDIETKRTAFQKH